MLVSPDPMAAATAVAASSAKSDAGGRVLQRARRAMSSIESKLRDASAGEMVDQHEKKTPDGESLDSSVWKDAREGPLAATRTASTIKEEVFLKEQKEEAKTDTDVGRHEGKSADRTDNDTQPTIQGPRERIRARRNRRGPPRAEFKPPAKINSQEDVDPRPPAGPPPRSGRWKAVPGRFRMPEKELLSSPSEVPRGSRRPFRQRKSSPLVVQAMKMDTIDSSTGSEEKSAETKISSSSPLP